MSLRHLAASEFIRQPWKNGGGTTTELARHDEGGAWLWRISIAEVGTSGPFSDFSGYQRTIMLLDGAGMELTFDCAPAVILGEPMRPFTFDGGWKTTCRLLDGPVRDFNVMVDRNRARASISTTPPAGPHDWALVYDLEDVPRPIYTCIDRL
jgi:environmental stress-induced protein Ves